MKKVIQITLNIEVDDNQISVDLVDINEENTEMLKTTDPEVTSFSVQGGDFVSNIAYHGSEEEWYITYKN